jgi:hypothetical protein
MAALKNRTVETESLESFVGKTVAFTNPDTDSETTGIITSVASDGYLNIETEDGEIFSAKPDEFKIVIAEETEEEEEETEEEEEETEEGEEEGEEEETEEVTKDYIESLNKAELKDLIKSEGIKVKNLRVWQDEKLMKATLLEHFKITENVETKKEVKPPVKKAPETKPVAKAEKPKVKEEAKKKETKAAGKPQSGSKKEMIVAFFKSGNFSIDDACKEINAKFPDKAASGTLFMISDYGTFLVQMGFFKKEGGRFIAVK